MPRNNTLILQVGTARGIYVRRLFAEMFNINSLLKPLLAGQCMCFEYCMIIQLFTLIPILYTRETHYKDAEHILQPKTTYLRLGLDPDKSKSNALQNTRFWLCLALINIFFWNDMIWF